MSIRVMTAVWDNGPKDQGELLVLLALADFADDEGYCWPSVSRVAEKARLTERGAQKIMRRLEDAGYLAVQANAGKGGTNRYRVTPNAVHPEPLFTPPLNTVHPHPEPLFTPPLNTGSPEPSRTIKEPSLNRHGDFDAFWSEVPRKVGKEAARKAYASALKKTDHATLIAGIRRYAQERAGQDEKYTAHPASWLNAGRWDDVPTVRQSFNDKLEGLFNGIELRIEGDDHRAEPERLSAPVQSSRPSDGTDRFGADQADGGGYQQAVARLIAPKRFGGSAF